MKAGMYYNNSDVRVVNLPVPEIRNGDILIKIMASGICGSDIMEWYRIKKAPLVLGHEIAGEIAEVGKDVKKFKKGDRVFSTHHVPCDQCAYCVNGHNTACDTFLTKNNFDPGGFSEYLKVTGKSIDTGTLILPDEVSYEEASFVEPLGTAVRAIKAINLNPGDNLLVLGAGIIGLLIIKLAKAMGAGRIIVTDINEYRLEAAKKYGAEHVVNANQDLPSFIKKVNNGRLAGKVIISAGVLSACKQALQSVDRGGTVLFFAVPKPGENVDVDFNAFWRIDVTLKTCYGASPLDNIQALEMIRSGNVNVSDMITHRFGIDDIAKAFKTAADGRDSLKVIVKPH
ncbi:MAG: zinc-dependent dehydrogenase [Oligoflexia bacterium]|nr:zinc-dependent dehydrogenase [Oligoflexia bacterium]